MGVFGDFALGKMRGFFASLRMTGKSKSKGKKQKQGQKQRQ
jgi:hypothetical protein